MITRRWRPKRRRILASWTADLIPVVTALLFPVAGVVAGIGLIADVIRKQQLAGEAVWEAAQSALQYAKENAAGDKATLEARAQQLRDGLDAFAGTLFDDDESKRAADAIAPIDVDVKRKPGAIFNATQTAARLSNSKIAVGPRRRRRP